MKNCAFFKGLEEFISRSLLFFPVNYRNKSKIPYDFCSGICSFYELLNLVWQYVISLSRLISNFQSCLTKCWKTLSCDHFRFPLLKIVETRKNVSRTSPWKYPPQKRACLLSGPTTISSMLVSQSKIRRTVPITPEP